MLRNAGRKLSLAALVGAIAMVCLPQIANAVGVLEMRKIISSPGQPSAADKATIDGYLNADFFRHFARPAGGGVKLPELRKDYGNMVRGVGRTPAHDYLNAVAFKYAEMVVRGSADFFPPVSKYNAMLLIADLNESDVPGAIKPYLPAVQTLGRTLAAPASDYDYLKVAALIGFTRMAEEKALPPNYVTPISGLLLKILADADPPAGESASAHNFMRRSAARALAAIGSPGPNNQVVTDMRTIVADPNARLTMRCEMAQYIGQLRIPPDANVDYKDLANLIGHLTVDICDQEILRATEEKREPSRAIFMYALRTADTALGGLSDSANKDPEASSFISKLRSKVSKLHGQLDDVSKTPDPKVLETVEPALEEIRESLLAKPEPPAAPLAGAAAMKRPVRPAG
jgi:hypothetical protein